MFCLYYTGVTPAERYASIINSLHQPLHGGCRSELAREQRRFAGDRSLREQARSYARADDWLRQSLILSLIDNIAQETVITTQGARVLVLCFN